VHGQLALNIFISGKILTLGRNNFNPTLLGRSINNWFVSPACKRASRGQRALAEQSNSFQRGGAKDFNRERRKRDERYFFKR
jgi:hypothetical protein